MPDCICTRPVDGANLCQACAVILERALAECPFLARELDTVITRQTTYATKSDGSRPTERPLPFHVAGSKTRKQLADALEVACATLIRTHHAKRYPYTRRPGHTSAFLLDHLKAIRVHDQAHKIHQSILTPVTKARWLIDRPADRWYAGPCNTEVDVDGKRVLCTAELYATTGKGAVTCRTCETTYDVAERRDWLLAAAEDQLATAATCARAVSWLGQTELTPSLIRVWHARGRLTAKGHEPYHGGNDPTRTRPLYRVGDVIDLVHEQAAKERKS